MNTTLTSYHAQYYAYELMRSRTADDQDKFTASLQDATVDLNPHQVEAALFAFKSPLYKGALLADEVGLGKTIEAGIILSRKWADDKRKSLKPKFPRIKNSNSLQYNQKTGKSTSIYWVQTNQFHSTDLKWCWFSILSNQRTF